MVWVVIGVGGTQAVVTIEDKVGAAWSAVGWIPIADEVTSGLVIELLPEVEASNMSEN